MSPGMCNCSMNRRTVLRLSGTASLTLAGGCDDVDLEADRLGLISMDAAATNRPRS